MFNACIWLSIAVLCFMLAVLAVLAGTMLLWPPTHSADLTTLGGILHLACRSEDFQWQLHGLSLADSSAVKQSIGALNTKYTVSGMGGRVQASCIVVHGG
jgi:hypothetical protein